MKTIQLIAGMTVLALSSVGASDLVPKNLPDDDPDAPPQKTYADDEKQKWIFQDGEPHTPEQIQREELMWELDGPVQEVRGAI